MNCKEKIINCAINMATKNGINSISFGKIVKEIGVSRTLIYRYFYNIKNLKQEVLELAIEKEIMEIVIEAIIFNKVFFSQGCRLRKKAAEYIWQPR